jgi:3-oxoacyl-(acyl-carrier-protein) synthase
MMTSITRGPWTPSTRWNSMSLVALGPLTNVSGAVASTTAAIQDSSNCLPGGNNDHMMVGQQEEHAATLVGGRVE